MSQRPTLGNRARCRTWDLSDATPELKPEPPKSVGVQCEPEPEPEPEDNGSDTTSDDAASITFSVASSVAPEPSEVDEPRALSDKAWDDTVPWPCFTYMIIEKATGRPLTMDPVTGEVFLPSADEAAETGTVQSAQEAAPTPQNTWWCANSQNYFGFLNTASGRYLGHNGFDAIHARFSQLRAWETFMARPHPHGGYQLLTQYWQAALQVVDIAPDGKHLIRRMHGGVLWEFRRIQK
ncbi:hypothetical protein PG984_012216 [Apiospora sp. TS-2023a]|uniref:Uncharacterized protein n=1 Tax=Apiospora saccharicola TaxID=335842 RepID=A0ABR1U661_9PEZI